MSDVVHKFSKVVPGWRPRLTPIKPDNLTPAQTAALAQAAPQGRASDLLLVLAHDPESLSARTPFFHGVMHDVGGLDHEARELAAIGASMVNGCVYCAATHAQRHIALVDDHSVVDDIFRFGADADLGPRDRAVFDFSRHLSDAPPRADQEDVQNLRDAGLSDVELLDLVLSTALFGWANRLMHGLGDAVRPGAG